MSLVVAALEIAFAAQAMQADVVGTVRSADTGEPVVNASVAMPDLGRIAITDSAGRYVMRQVPAAPQHVRVRALGYAPRTIHALVPHTGVLEIDVSLARIPYSLPAVAVRPSVAARGTMTGGSISHPDRSASIAEVSAHPLFSEPDVLSALGGGEVVVQPESPSGMHVRGGAADQTAYLLDGVPILSPYHAAGMFSAWNPDALSLISISTVFATGVTHALGGTVAALTGVPGDHLQIRGSASTTQTRLTLDGPIGPAGFLFGLRASPPPIIQRKEASYIRSEPQDWIAKVEVPVFGGELRVLGYDNDNEIVSAAVIGAEDARSVPLRHDFEWGGQSFGAEWRGKVRAAGDGALALRVMAWSASANARGAWAGTTTETALSADSRRRDVGLEATLGREAFGGATLGGIRLERMRTSYAVQRATPDAIWGLATSAPITTAFASHTRALTRRVEAEIGIVASVVASDVVLGPHARAQWSAPGHLTFSASYARLHQFAQSMRNSESVVGSIFPADLFVGVGGSGGANIPIGRSDVRIGAAEFRPFPGARVGLQLYDRTSHGLVLVAVRDSEPFATTPVAVGAGTTRGVAAEAGLSSSRLGLLVSYGAQRVRYWHGDSSFVPGHGTAHLIEGGATVFPTRTSSIRLGVMTGWGRRGTPIAGAFEWEACNLRDGGCEFSGSPRARIDALGQSRLPPYFRVDLGVRQHWHVDVGGRDVELTVFGAMTNILNRRNVLAYATQPVTGERVEVEMRSRAPLVAGLDWRY